MSLLLMIAVTGVSVQTHYCNGNARYSTVALDSEPSSCCGDDMPACPSCKDEMSSNVMTTPTTVMLPADGSGDFTVCATVGAVLPAALPEIVGAQPDAAALGPPGVLRGSTIPILVSSFLI
ncbi:MAG: hypothetical protein IH600_11190 [Bacteroidetes bacterium]|nr:hypothetical protein [Bacteroidota bacterium]